MHGYYLKLFLAVLLLCVLAVVAPILCAEPNGYGPYDATVPRVVDGDTVQIAAGVWPGLTADTMLRLEGIDTPEIRTSRLCEKQLGEAARSYLVQRIDTANHIVVNNIILDKYGGRVVGELLLDGANASQLMVQSGHAVPYHGGARPPWPCP